LAIYYFLMWHRPASWADYLEGHMRRTLALVLFDDEDNAAAGARWNLSLEDSRKKARARPTDLAHGEALPVHNFRTLLAGLATLTRNTIRFDG
jgi:hypothetical protein